MRLPIAASTLLTACGAGKDAVRASLRRNEGGLRPNDFELAAGLATWIGRVEGVEDFALPPALSRFDCRNNRLASMCLLLDGFSDAVAACVRRHGADRVGIFLGTSTSGILDTEQSFCAARADEGGGTLSPESYRCRHSMHSVTELVRGVLGLRGPAMTVSTACSSSAKVFAHAARYIEAGLCDAAVVGGADSLTLSTLFGFNALSLLSREPCRPFDAARDGISIGEGAGFALIDRAAESDVALEGYGESCDAYHMSTPHPEGAGAVAAMRQALSRARVDPALIGYVNLHGTASRANDTAEDLALRSVFERPTPASSTKGWTGHMLGAAGIAEAVVCMMALTDGFLPGTRNCREVDPQVRSHILREGLQSQAAHVMTTSFGFGGNNCALVFGRMQ